MPGDELKLCYHGELHKRWEGVGHVSKMPSSIHNVIPVYVCHTVLYIRDHEGLSP